MTVDQLYAQFSKLTFMLLLPNGDIMILWEHQMVLRINFALEPIDTDDITLLKKPHLIGGRFKLLIDNFKLDAWRLTHISLRAIIIWVISVIRSEMQKTFRNKRLTNMLIVCSNVTSLKIRQEIISRTVIPCLYQ